VLGLLRRVGRPYRLTPGELAAQADLSTGAMTNRLDRLEEAGWIRREPDPEDRRGVVVGLTPAGRKRIDAATATRFGEAKRSLPPLDANEVGELKDLLRKWLTAIEPENGAKSFRGG